MKKAFIFFKALFVVATLVATLVAASSTLFLLVFISRETKKDDPSTFPDYPEDNSMLNSK